MAVLISGGGTTLKNLLDRIGAGTLDAAVQLVVSSNPNAGGLEFARQASIPAIVVERRLHATSEEFSHAVFGPCREARVHLVVMGGFLKHVIIPPDFQNRVMNIHPALIPAFCGKGFYGSHVHQAVLDYGAKVSGCTVHFADNQYDHGPIILQRPVEVRDDDSADSLAKRVFTAECEAYPEAIRLFAEGRLRIEGRRVSVQ
jgi:phosphoribosylglycinamide formyltransferase-1